VAAFASVVASKSQEPFSSTGTEVRAGGAGGLVSLMHQLLIMPSGPHRVEGGSCVSGGGSGIFDPTIQNSHLPGLIASSAPGRARPHLGYENENGSCPNSCRSSHFYLRSYA
jgi:hypothetical protein